MNTRKWRPHERRFKHERLWLVVDGPLPKGSSEFAVVDRSTHCCIYSGPLKDCAAFIAKSPEAFREWPRRQEAAP